MTRRKLKQAVADEKPNNALVVDQSPDEAAFVAMARKVLEPGFRHGLASANFANKSLGSGITAPGLMDYTQHLIAEGDKAAIGDMAVVSRMLVSQAITLDSMFTELARRGAVNMGEYPDAAERYLRLAMKAQGNSRATLEALAKIHQPREQVVRHVHVNEGGQAVIAENFHAYRGQENTDASGQVHEQGEGCPSLPSPNACGNSVPVTSPAGKEALQAARGSLHGRA